MKVWRRRADENERLVSKTGKDGLKQLMGSLGNSWSCNDLPQNGHLGLHTLQTEEQTEIEKIGTRWHKILIEKIGERDIHI